MGIFEIFRKKESEENSKKRKVKTHPLLYPEGPIERGVNLVEELKKIEKEIERLESNEETRKSNENYLNILRGKRRLYLEWLVQQQEEERAKK
jgi:hypothetical protein